MSTLTLLDELKALVHTKVQKETLACSLWASGIPKGAITEISGIGKTEFVLKFLSEYPEMKVAWIERNFSAYPFGFLQRKVALNRVLFVEADEHIYWVTKQVIAAQFFSAVVVYSDTPDIKALQRLMIASEKSQSCVIILSSHPQNLWPINLQLRVKKNRSALCVEALKRRS